MSDNFKRYNCIKVGLRQLLPKGLSAYELKMLDHLAKLINGIIGAGNCQLPKIAAKDPRAIKTESKISTLKRLLLKTEFSPELFWLPFVRQFLESLAKSRNEFVLVMDGSEVGRGCMALVMSLVYAGRALPIGRLVVSGNKGHLSEELHLQLLEQVHALVPNGFKVVFLGDGEFDETWLQESVWQWQYGWNWVVRTAKNHLH